MKTTPLSSIKIGDRQRKHIDEDSILELAESIHTKGLLHPVVLLKIKGKKKSFTLVAGERRLRAINSLFCEGKPFRCDGELILAGSVPYILISDMDKILIRETELEENLIREDLTWQEEVAALHELHQIRLAQNPKQSDADTAREIVGMSRDNPESAEWSKPIDTKRRAVARAKIIAPHLDDPVVAGAGSAQKAFAVVAAKLEAEFTAELARRGEIGETEHVLIAGDLREELKKLPSGMFTCIVADPPYGIDADKFGDVAALEHNYVDDKETAIELAFAIADDTQRITEDEAHLYMFCDIDLFTHLRDEINNNTEWNCWRTPIIWDKGTGYAPIQSSGFQRTYEMILFASKGGKSFATAHKDIIYCAPDKNKVHAAGKPFQLYAEFFKYSCIPGDKVLDPCCGAGAVFSGAVAAGVVATGIEIDSQWLDYARVRMHQEE